MHEIISTILIFLFDNLININNHRFDQHMCVVIIRNYTVT